MFPDGIMNITSGNDRVRSMKIIDPPGHIEIELGPDFCAIRLITDLELARRIVNLSEFHPRILGNRSATNMIFYAAETAVLHPLCKGEVADAISRLSRICYDIIYSGC